MELQAETVRCNCSICAKTRAWLVFAPASTFRLLQGEPNLADYRFGAGRIRHRFCTTCGVKPFGVAGDGVAISIACLDELAPEQLATLSVTCIDGAQDRWDAAPAITAYL